MKQPHIVIFLHRAIHTGGQRYLAEVFQYLHRNGVSIVPIYLDDFPKRYRRLGLVLDCLICNLWLFGRARETKHLDEVVFFEDVYLRPRLWLFNMLIRLSTGRLKTVALVQNVLTNHRLLENRILRRLDDLLAWLFFRQAGLVLANSEFVRQKVLARGVSAEKTKVVYCGYHGLRDERAGTSDVVQPDDDVQRILFVGQCEPYKGVDILLRAIAELKHDKDHHAVDIVGSVEADAAYYHQLLKIVEKEILGERVRFWGHVSDKDQLRRFYEGADVFVLPSRYEGFGIVVLEAMSFGLPIVATTAGAIPELVEDGRHGLLVAPGDPHALAQAIQKLCDSPDLRAEYGRNGYAFVRDKREFYTWEAVGERILDALEALSS